MKNIILTEGSLNSQRGGLLGFITKTQLIDSLDTEHIGFSFGQTTNNKPAGTESHVKTMSDQTERHLSAVRCVFVWLKTYLVLL